MARATSPASNRSTTGMVRRFFTGRPEQRLAYVTHVAEPVMPERGVDFLTRAWTRMSRSVRVDRLARVAAVSRAVEGRDAVVRAATRGREDFDSVCAAIDAMAKPGDGSTSAPLRALGPHHARTLAWLLCVQNLDERDRERAVALYDWSRAGSANEPLPARHHRAFAEALLAVGEVDRARAEVRAFATSPGSRLTTADEFLAAETLNPVKGDAGDGAGAGDAGASEAAWREAFAAIWERHGLEPVALTDDVDAAAFDRLTADAVSTVRGPTTITVVISAYQPDHRLVGAVRSVAASSWEDIDILVVDDASGQAYDHWYTTVAELDPRVRVERMDTNGGTYRIRNHALRIARGELVTFHDSDDWMHPRRLELQAQHLLDHPDVVANASRSARVTEHLEFSHSRNLGAQICEPSLMLRRDHALAAVGFFDPLRKGADAEYRMRLERVVGAPTPVVGEAPMTLQLIVDGSLSNVDIIRHWFHPDRRVYRSCFEQWHRAAAASGDGPRLDLPDAPERPMYAPARMRGQAPPSACDVVLVSAWLESGTWGTVDRDALALLEQLLAAGHRVGLAHVNALKPIKGMRLALAPRISALLNETALEWVSLNDPLEAAVVVADPDVWDSVSHRVSGAAVVPWRSSGSTSVSLAKVTAAMT